MYTSLYATKKGDILRILRDKFPEDDGRSVHLKHVGLIDFESLSNLLDGEGGSFLAEAKTSLLSLVWTRFEAPIMEIPSSMMAALAELDGEQM